MTTLSLHLLDPTQQRLIDGVSSFTGEDASGSFGILPGHARFITALPPGLARYKTHDSDWRYIALASATLYFMDNTLQLSGQRFLLCDDVHSIEQALQNVLAQEEENLGSLTRHVKRVEEEMFRRLSRLNGGQMEISE